MKTTPGANETGKVIFDNECREYREGWNACNEGKHYLANPYGIAYDGELHRLWQKGFNECQERWDTSALNPGSYSPYEIQSSFTVTDPKNHSQP